MYVHGQPKTIRVILQGVSPVKETLLNKDETI